MADGGIGNACTKGVVAGLLVGWGVQSGGCVGIDCASSDFLEVSMVTTPAAALAFSMVLLDQPEPSGGLLLFLFFSFVVAITNPFEREMLIKRFSRCVREVIVSRRARSE